LILLQKTRAHEEGLSEVQGDKKRGGPRSDVASTTRKQTNQAGVTEEAVEESCDVLSVNLGGGKERFLDVWLLDSGCTYHMCPRKKWFSIYEPFE